MDLHWPIYLAQSNESKCQVQKLDQPDYNQVK